MSVMNSVLVLSLWMVCATAFPFPVVRRSSGFSGLRRGDLYGQEAFADRSYYGVPATRSGVSRSAWPYLNDYVLNRAPRGPIQAGSVTYGVPGDAVWADALLRFDETSGRMGENKPQEVVAQLLRRQEPYDAVRALAPNVDYGMEDEEEYDNTADFVPELTPELNPEMLGYASQFQGFPEEEVAPVYDTLRVVPQAMGAPEENNAMYRESILPYLLLSALEAEGKTGNRGTADMAPEGSQFGEIKTEIQLPGGGNLMTVNNNLNRNSLNNVNRVVPSTESLDDNNNKRTQSAPGKIAEPVAPTQAPVTATEATPSTTSTSEPVQKPKSSFIHRGQEEVAMLRPPSDRHRFSSSLTALSWPKELEEDDTEEQKRQLRELPLENGDTKTEYPKTADAAMVPVSHSARKWPAALDEVDDWLADQLDQLKSRRNR